MRFVSAEEIESVVRFPDLIVALKLAFADGKVVAPLRHQHAFANPHAEEDSTLIMMPAWSPGEAVGVKLVIVAPNNDRLGLPSVQGQYILFDADSGVPKLALDAKSLTAMRTAAASALASTYLSRPNSKTLLMVGTGALAPQLIRAHAAVRPIEVAYVWGRNQDKAARLAESLELEPFAVEPVGSMQEGVARADIISCATLSAEPLIHGESLLPGQHLDLVGSFRPDMREADDAAVARCSIFVDHYEGALAETGDIAMPISRGVLHRDDLKAELTELCSGSHRGRVDDQEMTLFKSVGHALEDLAAAQLIESLI